MKISEVFKPQLPQKLFIQILLFIIPNISSPSVYYCHQNNTENNFLRFITINIRTSVKKDSINRWENRKNLLLDYLKCDSFGIICMQEATMLQMKFFKENLIGYEYVGSKYNVVRGEEYLPIFYSNNEFDYLDDGTFWLSENPDSVGSKGWDAAIVRRVTWVKLKSKHTDKELIVANTHLDHKGPISRVSSVKLIKKRMVDIAGNLPVIICGDMNSEQGSQSYYAALNNDFIMYDAYQIAKKRKGVVYTYHAFGMQPIVKRKMVDYIFVTKDLSVDKIDIPVEYPINNIYLTDHNPVIADIKF